MRRLRNLSGASGYRLTLAEVRETPDTASVERMTHWLLRTARLHGEWFSVDAATAQAAVTEAIARIELGEAIPRDLPQRKVRAKLFPSRIVLPLTREMLKRADAALVDGEVRLDLIRQAVAAELKRRERQKAS